MNSREKVMQIFQHKGEEGAMWTGHPSEDILPILADAWHIDGRREAVYRYLQDDCRWFMADGCYRHPEGRPAFDASYGMGARETLSAAGCFADAENVAEIEAYPWPNPAYCDFAPLYQEIDRFADKMVFTGMWSPFFHIVADFFGMEEFFVKMYTAPAVVEAAIEKTVDFFVAANERFFAELGDRADVMFFGNDLGTQRDMILSPVLFRQFLLPSIKRIIAVGKKHNKKIMMHSCGSIHKIIPDLIEAGVDILHPIQAQAVGMDAESLACYKNDLAFVGGIDAQTFFVNASPEEVKREVYRVKERLGASIVISPSHEEILPNVPPQNLLAMAEAARR